MKNLEIVTDPKYVHNWDLGGMREAFNADPNDLEEGDGSNVQGIATIIIYVQMSIYRINSKNGLHKYLKNELCASKSNELHNNDKNRK